MSARTLGAPAAPLAALLAVTLAACADHVPTAPTSAPTLARAGEPASTSGVVMRGLANPRQLAFGPEGALYVAEAGTEAITGPCVSIPRGQNCYSGTGAISRLWKGQQERVAAGLPSVFNPGTGEAAGPHDIDFQGLGNGYVTIGWGADPALRAGLGARGAALGTLIRVQPNGKWQIATDIGAFETANNPAGGPLDSNPYGVLAEPGRQFVADAGGNSLLEIRTNGQVSLVATFAPIPVPPGAFNPPFAQSEAVPTEVTRGPDGALYASTLTGVPFLPGAAAIYRVTPGQAPQLYRGGFTSVTDFDWGRDGSLYVVQYASGPFLSGPGAVIRVAPDGARTTLLATLTHPTGIAVGPDGAVYVVDHGDSPTAGEVLRLVP